MQVRKAKGFLGHTAIVVDEAQAGVADWNQTEVEVNAKAHGALGDMLNLVQGSALSALTAHVLDSSRATGNAKLSLKLHLPTLHMERSKVQGEVALSGNTLQLMPEVPALSQLRGNVQFSETGFQLSGVQARALGGDVRIEGGMKPGADAATAPVRLRVDGMATAQGLRDAKEMSELAALGKHLQGQARYGLQIKVLHSVPEISLQSELQGMAVMLPAPLGKAADSFLALRVNRTVPAVAKPLTDQAQRAMGQSGRSPAGARYQRGTGPHHARQPGAWWSLARRKPHCRLRVCRPGCSCRCWIWMPGEAVARGRSERCRWPRCRGRELASVCASATGAQGTRGQAPWPLAARCIPAAQPCQQDLEQPDPGARAWPGALNIARPVRRSLAAWSSPSSRV